MSEVTATIIDIRRLRPVKWSRIDKKVQPVQQSLVAVFLKYEGCPLVDEDGDPMLSPAGQQQSVRAASFARRYSVAVRTFQKWLVEERGITTPSNQRFRNKANRADEARNEQHGQCSHCPEWTEE
jgi:hypothetical protein